MIRPNSRLAAGALLLCIAAGGWGEEPKSTVTPSSGAKPERTASKPQPILPPANAEHFGEGNAPVLRPEATSRLIPAIPVRSRSLPSPAPAVGKEPVLPTRVLPKPAVTKGPMVAKEGQKLEGAATPSTRVGRTGLREDEGVPVPAASPLKDEDSLRRKPKAIDPKEMAPMDAKKGRVLPIRPVAGAVVNPDSALSATSLDQESILTPDFVRKGAMNAGMSKDLANQMVSIISGTTGSNDAAIVGKDRWVIEACQSLNEYPEGERAAAFQEILRVYQRRRAAEGTAAEKRQ